MLASAYNWNANSNLNKAKSNLQETKIRCFNSTKQIYYNGNVPTYIIRSNYLCFQVFIFQEEGVRHSKRK